MDEDLRKYALHEAVLSITGAPFTEVVRAAEAFHAFLDPSVKAQAAACQDYDLAQADQSPPRAGADGKGFAIIGGDPNIYEVGRNATLTPARAEAFLGGQDVYASGTAVERDADNIPTRIIRHEDLPPEAA